LELGNMDAKRDWGHAQDYVNAMYLMLQQDKPSDYVIATGETHTVRTFVELCFNHVGITLEWHGQGLDEIGINKHTGATVLKINPKFYRPAEVDILLGDPSKAEQQLGWQRQVSFEQLVERMMAHDLSEVALCKS